MGEEISKGLEITLIIHFILGIILGFIFLFIPDVYCKLVGFSITDKGTFRIIGAASLALGYGSFLAYRSRDWEKVKLLVQLDLVWLISATGAMLFWIFFEKGPIAGWFIIAMFAAFLVVFTYFYFKENK